MLFLPYEQTQFAKLSCILGKWHKLGQGSTDFLKIHKSFPNLRHQEGDIKQGLYWGPTVLKWLWSHCHLVLVITLSSGSFCSGHINWHTFLYVVKKLQ